MSFLNENGWITDAYQDIEDIRLSVDNNKIYSLKPEDVIHFRIGVYDMITSEKTMCRLSHAILCENYAYARALEDKAARGATGNWQQFYYLVNGLNTEETVKVIKYCLISTYANEWKYSIIYYNFPNLEEIISKMPKILDLAVYKYNMLTFKNTSDAKIILQSNFQCTRESWFESWYRRELTDELMRLYLDAGFDMYVHADNDRNILHDIFSNKRDLHIKIINSKYLATTYPNVYKHLINEQDLYGDTPVHVLQRTTTVSWDTLREFIDYGFDINIKNKTGELCIPVPPLDILKLIV